MTAHSPSQSTANLSLGPHPQLHGWHAEGCSLGYPLPSVLLLSQGSEEWVEFVSLDSPRKLRLHRGAFTPKLSDLQTLHPTGIQHSDDVLPSRSHASFPKLELGLGHRPSPTREPPTCSICLERLREPISLDCGHDFCIRCFSTHRIPGCELPCCPECRKICKQRKGLRSLGERMKLLPQRPLPPALQVRDAISACRDLR
jgi:hypothetical protein